MSRQNEITDDNPMMKKKIIIGYLLLSLPHFICGDIDLVFFIIWHWLKVAFLNPERELKMLGWREEFSVILECYMCEIIKRTQLYCVYAKGCLRIHEESIMRIREIRLGSFNLGVWLAHWLDIRLCNLKVASSSLFSSTRII